MKADEKIKAFFRRLWEKEKRRIRFEIFNWDFYFKQHFILLFMFIVIAAGAGYINGSVSMCQDMNGYASGNWWDIQCLILPGDMDLYGNRFYPEALNISIGENTTNSTIFIVPKI
jgi:hypothetical protein